MDKIRIVLVDDHEIVRNGIKSILNNFEELEIVGEASNGVEAISIINQLNPDIAMLDITMPEMNGIEATQIIKTQNPSVKCLMLSMHDHQEYIIKSVQAGASGYLLKDTTSDEMLKAIKTIAKGERYFSNPVSNILVDGMLSSNLNSRNNFAFGVANTDVSEVLSKKEKEVLSHIVKGLNSRQIADRLGLSIRTVDNHRANMMKKLEVKNAAELVKMAMEKKLV